MGEKAGRRQRGCLSGDGRGSEQVTEVPAPWHRKST